MRGDTHGKCTGHEPITGVWGRALSGIQGQSPMSGGKGAKPLKLKTFYF